MRTRSYDTSITCEVAYAPPPEGRRMYYELDAACGSRGGKLRMLPGETTIDVRVYLDHTFLEAFFQGGRLAITEAVALHDASALALT